MEVVKISTLKCDFFTYFINVGILPAIKSVIRLFGGLCLPPRRADSVAAALKSTASIFSGHLEKF